MKKISILIPCYNEEENVGPISEAVVETLERDLPEYDYELVFIDNDSTDQTRPILRKICSENPRIKAIFNAKNFGQFQFPVLWNVTVYRRLRDQHGGRFSGSGRYDPEICP